MDLKGEIGACYQHCEELFHLVLVGIQTVFCMPNSQKFCKGIER